MRTARLTPLLLLLFHACADDQDALVGRWRAAHDYVLEFREDGTVDLGGGFGGRFHTTEDGKLQIETPLTGPLTRSYVMYGDSMRLEESMRPGASVILYRDRGDRPPQQFALQGAPSVSGNCVEVYEGWAPFGNSAPARTETVPVSARFAAGTLVLDPVTHAFTQTLTLELRGGQGTAALPPRAVSETYRGRYSEQNGSIVLRYERAGSLTEVVGRRSGSEVTLSGTDLFRVMSTEERRPLGGRFHAGVGSHQLSWQPAPELAFRISSAS